MENENLVSAEYTSYLMAEKNSYMSIKVFLTSPLDTSVLHLFS